MAVLISKCDAPDQPIETDPPAPPDDFDSDDEGGGDGDGQPIRWATVATYWDPTEAHIGRLKLESEDIDCIILDENIVATQWIWAGALGGVKLQVPREDLIRARELLTTTAQKNLHRANGEPLFDGQLRCPQCGSEDIHTVRLSRKIAMLTLLFLGIPLPFLHRRQHCAACGFEWRPEEHLR